MKTCHPSKFERGLLHVERDMVCCARDLKVRLYKIEQSCPYREYQVANQNLKLDEEKLGLEVLNCTAKIFPLLTTHGYADFIYFDGQYEPGHSVPNHHNLDKQVNKSNTRRPLIPQLDNQTDEEICYATKDVEEAP